CVVEGGVVVSKELELYAASSFVRNGSNINSVCVCVCVCVARFLILSQIDTETRRVFLTSYRRSEGLFRWALPHSTRTFLSEMLLLVVRTFQYSSTSRN